MPYETDCSHKRCAGGPCKMLMPHEVEPQQHELEYAQALINEGWKSISARHRRIARLTREWPTAEEMIKPEMLFTVAGKEMAELWQRHRNHLLRKLASGGEVQRQFIEIRELNVRHFRAFKLLGGQSA